VEGLESANTAQQLEILKLKARVKKLERLNKFKSSKLMRLKKVGTFQRIESSEDEENVFNQGRISVDIDEGIELVDDQEKDVQVKRRQADTQAEIYNIDLDHTSKVLSMQEDSEVQEVVEVVNAAKLITEVVTAATTQVIPAAEPVVVAVSTPISVVKPKKPQSESEARKNIIDYLKNTEGFKLAFFKGKTYDQIRLIFQARFDANMRFLLKSKEEMEKEEEEI
nr:hypothetical protein [Tanacetum cinerariifolium]